MLHLIEADSVLHIFVGFSFAVFLSVHSSSVLCLTPVSHCASLCVSLTVSCCAAFFPSLSYLILLSSFSLYLPPFPSPLLCSVFLTLASLPPCVAAKARRLSLPR